MDRVFQTSRSLEFGSLSEEGPARLMWRKLLACRVDTRAGAWTFAAPSSQSGDQPAITEQLLAESQQVRVRLKVA